MNSYNTYRHAFLKAASAAIVSDAASSAAAKATPLRIGLGIAGLVGGTYGGWRLGKKLDSPPAASPAPQELQPVKKIRK